jgi:hypothetical protein
MRVIAVIDQRDLVERILRHLGLWSNPVRAGPGCPPYQDLT